MSQFTPQGEALQVQQVRVQFDAPVRPLGEVAGSAPLSFVCQGLGAVTARARWQDERTWAVDFSEMLPAGVRCEFTPVAGMLDMAGQPVSMAAGYRFNTGGPWAREVTVLGWNTQRIDEEAVFVVRAAGEVERSSVEQQVVCVADGIVENIPVKLLSVAEQQKLATRAQRDDLQPDPRLLLLQCARRLPNGARLRLHWGAGIRGRSGLLTSAASASWHEFRVRGEFSVTVNCQRENARVGCHPLTPVTLDFSAPVMRADAEKLRLVSAQGRTWMPQPFDEGGANGADGEDGAWVDRVSFQGPFPPDSVLHLKLPAQLRDDAGRPLAHRERLAVLRLKTADYPPLLKFAADFGIVEYKAGGLLPVTMRNLDTLPAEAGLLTMDGTPPGTAARVRVRRATRDEEVIELFRLVATMPEGGQDVRSVSLLRQDARAKTWLLPKPQGAQPMEVVGLPLGEPGYYLVEAESARLGSSLLEKSAPMFVHAAALNTNLAVHFKQGAENQLVWVTTLDGGQPVADARISIRDCRGTQLAFGRTGADGTMAVRRPLPSQPRACSPGLWSYYVSARTTGAVGGVEDFSFVLSSWKDGIEPWRFQLPSGYADLPAVLMHTVFDRPLFRAGETVHMKHMARRHTTAGYGWVPRQQLPDQAVIQLENSDVQYTLPLSWKGGSAESVWTVPTDARLGKYWVSFLRSGERVTRVQGGDGYAEGDGRDEGSETGEAGEAGGDAYGNPGRYWRGGSFRVGEFRLPVLKGEVAPTRASVTGSRAAVDLRLAYLAGGAASGEKVRVRSELTPWGGDASAAAEDWADYRFNSPPVNAERMSRGEWQEEAPAPVVFDDQRDVVLDGAGSRRLNLGEIPPWKVAGLLRTEMEYADPAGEIHVASAAVRWLPASVQVGIATVTAQGGKAGTVRIVTVDADWKPRPGSQYRVMAWQIRTLVHRKRLIGGYYAYDTQYVPQPLGEICSGRTDPQGRAECALKLPVDGGSAGASAAMSSMQVVLEAVSSDEGQRQSQASTSLWLNGRGEEGDASWFDQGDSDRIDIKPDKKRYEPGETARFIVQMPFRQATALVTVEREGVMDRLVMPLSGAQPGFSLPIKAHYGPNVFVSVLIVRGRIGEVQPTALVDLGKPAYKLGISEIEVGRKGYELKVAVEPAQAVYRTREVARVRVRVSKPDGSPAQGGEFALAAVDEALLELAPNRSWDLLTRLLAKRGYSVATATAQSQVVGKRHFGLKAVPAGGGGGRQPTRELFDTLIHWQARVMLDDKGEATVSLPLNDSLTRIRVVAVAQQGVALFGTGMASFRTTKDVQLFSGLPPVVRDADRFRAAFTLRNLTTAAGEFAVDASVKAQIVGQRDGQQIPLPALQRQKIQLAAGESRLVSWTLAVPENASRLDWRVEARSMAVADAAVAAAGASDALQLTQKVVPGTPVRVQAAVLAQVDGALSLPVQLPQTALPGRGGLDVALQPSLGVARAGVQDWMAAYPHQCLEQQISRALATASPLRWAQIQNTMSAYLDNNGLAAYFRNPRMNGGSPVLTAYILTAAQLAGHAVDEEVRGRMLQGLQGFVEGRLAADERYWSPRDARLDLALRKLKAIEALARYGQATPSMLASVPLTPGTWPLSGVVSWLAILQHLPDLPNRATLLNEAEAQIRARLQRTGTLTQFVRETDDAWWWQMDTPDGTAARVVTTLMEQPAWRAEIPLLVRGVVARQRAARWATTTANAWGVIMLDRFQRQFEKVAVSGTTEVAVETAQGKAAQSQSQSRQLIDWTHAPQPGARLQFDWPTGGAAGGVRGDAKPLPANVLVRHQGSGKPWMTLQTRAAVPLTAARDAGFAVQKELVAIERSKPGVWSRGDVVEVRLSIASPAAWTWVVVDDPIPAGTTILGSGLGRESQMKSARPDGEHLGSWWSQPEYVERSFEAYRAYYAYFRGSAREPVRITYRLRLNNAGDFTLPATHVEAMYAPENFGELPNAVWRVGE
ncbi:MAG: hypothetical protein KBD60_06895 [Sterolibacterium sp.]|nr:hypothetical protein [Sterolibacterium sp.]